MHKRHLLGAVFLIVFGVTATLAQSNTSVYTNLTGRQCKTLKSTSSEGGSYEGQCPGVALPNSQVNISTTTSRVLTSE